MHAESDFKFIVEYVILKDRLVFHYGHFENSGGGEFDWKLEKGLEVCLFVDAQRRNLNSRFNLSVVFTLCCGVLPSLETKNKMLRSSSCVKPFPSKMRLNSKQCQSSKNIKMHIKMKMGERYAVVTGANKGIGLEIVRKLAEEEGVVVVLTARDEKRGMAAKSSLVNSSNVVFHQLDVCDPASAQSLVQFIQTQFGRLDILVNNAGQSGVIVDEDGLKALNIDPVAWLSGKATKTVQDVIHQTYEMAERCLDTNYYGCKRVTEALIPLLKLSTSGARIVNVSSLRSELKRFPNEQTRKELGDINTLTEEKLDYIIENFLHDLKHGKLEENGWPIMLPSYSISKMTLNAYTRILAKKYPDMYVNCVHPGYVNTDINWHNGTMPVEEGARGPVMLALLQNGGPSGCYFDQTEIAEF